MFKKCTFLIGLLFFTPLSFAEYLTMGKLFAKGKNFIKVSGAVGGDAVATTTAGDDLNAGNAFTFMLGRDARYSNFSKRFLRFSVGYKYGFLKASDATATISAIPVNALYMQQNAKLVYGGGLTTHINAKSKNNGSQASLSESLSLGLTGQFAYRLSSTSEVGALADFISYGNFSANAIGIFYVKRFE